MSTFPLLPYCFSRTLPISYMYYIPSECYIDRGVTYRGKRSKTFDGTTCLRWDDDLVTPYLHPGLYWSVEDLVASANYCRNPHNMMDGPGCFMEVAGYGEYEHCGIPMCSLDGRCWKMGLLGNVSISRLLHEQTEICCYHITQLHDL